VYRKCGSGRKEWRTKVNHDASIGAAAVGEKAHLGTKQTLIIVKKSNL